MILKTLLCADTHAGYNNRGRVVTEFFLERNLQGLNADLY